MSFQLYVKPFNNFTLSNGFSIGFILVFNLLSDANAITFPFVENVPVPVNVAILVVPAYHLKAVGVPAYEEEGTLCHKLRELIPIA